MDKKEKSQILKSINMSPYYARKRLFSFRRYAIYRDSIPIDIECVGKKTTKDVLSQLNLGFNDGVNDGIELEKLSNG